MEFSLQLFLLALFLPLVISINPIMFRCSRNFTNNYVLKNNIKITNSELVANTSKGFAISTIGNGRNIVYDLSGCRGDIGRQPCSHCIASAARRLQKICPNTASSRILYELCFIRFDTTDFIGLADISDAIVGRRVEEFADFQKVIGTIWKLLNWVKVNASSESNRFGMGEIKSTLNGTKTIYGIAQCTNDLQKSTCMQCLNVMSTLLADHCENHVGCYVKSSSCMIRYEIYNFFFAKTIPVLDK